MGRNGFGVGVEAVVTLLPLQNNVSNIEKKKKKNFTPNGNENSFLSHENEMDASVLCALHA